MNKTDKHIFSFFTSQKIATITNNNNQNLCKIFDPDLWHRMINVLRLDTKNLCLIFNESTLFYIELSEETTKKKGVVLGNILTTKPIKPFTQKIHLYQGLLRREAFDAVAYTAAQMGITSLTPLLTQKIQRKWGGDKEFSKLNLTMIAACEQSKQFVIPTIKPPEDFIKIKSLITKFNGYWIYFDPSGKKLNNLINNITNTTNIDLHIIIGPEGGLSNEEQILLQNQNIHCYKLTQTILRAQDAAILSLGIMRSFMIFEDLDF